MHEQLSYSSFLPQNYAVEAYQRIEGVENCRLQVEHPKAHSAEKFAQQVIQMASFAEKSAVALANMKREGAVHLAKNPHLARFIARTHPYVTSPGETAEEKWLAYQRDLLFPEPLLDAFEAVDPGQKEAWVHTLNDALATASTDEPRMFTAGLFTGFAMTVVQDGEKLFRSAGVPFPTELTLATQTAVSLIAQGTRYGATETYWNVDAMKEGAGKAVSEIFARLQVPNAYRGTNWQDVTAQIFESYRNYENDRKFIAHIKGLGMGLVLGKLMLGNPMEAIEYGVAVSAIEYYLGSKYPQALEPMIDKYVKIKKSRRRSLEEGRVLARIHDLPLISSLRHAESDEHDRRRLATLKNTFEGTVTALIPIFASLATKVTTQATLQSQMYTWAMVALTVRERAINAMSARDASLLGVQAISDMDEALTSVLENPQRRPPMDSDRRREQGQILPESKRADLVIRAIGTSDYTDREGHSRSGLTVSTPFIVKPGDCSIILGGAQSGKSSTLRILMGDENGQPQKSDIRLGAQQIGQAPRSALKELYHSISSETVFPLSPREILVRVASQPNVLGTFDKKDIDRLLKLKNISEANDHPIITAFLKYCQTYDILQRGNTIGPHWFTEHGFVPSGSQGGLLKLALDTCIDGTVLPKIFIIDEPTKEFDQRAKEEWIQFIERRLPNSGHRMIISVNDTLDLDKTTGWLMMTNLGSILDIQKSQATMISRFTLPHVQMSTYQSAEDEDLRPYHERWAQLMGVLASTAKELVELKDVNGKVELDRPIWYGQQHIQDLPTYESVCSNLIGAQIQNFRAIRTLIEESPITMDLTQVEAIVMDMIPTLYKRMGQPEHIVEPNLINLYEPKIGYYDFHRYMIDKIEMPPQEFYDKTGGSAVRAFILLSEIEGLMRLGNATQFPRWFAAYSGRDKSIYELINMQISQLQFELKHTTNTRFEREKTFTNRWYPLLRYNAFYRYAASYDQQIFHFIAQDLLEMIRNGVFDTREEELQHFLSLTINPAIPTSMGEVLQKSDPELETNILVALRYRQIS